MVNVVDNALDMKYFSALKAHVESDMFPWYWNDYITDSSYEDDRYQLVHTVYNQQVNSTLHEYLTPLYNYLNVDKLIRCKINLNTSTEQLIKNRLHIDYPNVTTTILYINTNNGYTFFEEGQKITSVENRVLTFNSNLLHAGTSCTDKKRRIMINLNYIPNHKIIKSYK